MFGGQTCSSGSAPLDIHQDCLELTFRNYSQSEFCLDRTHSFIYTYEAVNFRGVRSMHKTAAVVT